MATLRVSCVPASVARVEPNRSHILTIKVVINRVHGGFDLSKEAMELYAKLKGVKLEQWDESIETYTDDLVNPYMIPRDDPALVAVVEKLGEQANSLYSHLSIVEIPEDVNWYIEEYDGLEWVAERHRKWF